MQAVFCCISFWIFQHGNKSWWCFDLIIISSGACCLQICKSIKSCWLGGNNWLVRKAPGKADYLCPSHTWPAASASKSFSHFNQTNCQRVTTEKNRLCLELLICRFEPYESFQEQKLRTTFFKCWNCIKHQSLTLYWPYRSARCLQK